jgi:CheY-like chemotaxis protein
VIGDPHRLRQILLNLIGNAIKFTTEGHVKLVIERSDHMLWHFSVEDSGVGISPEKQSIIFDSFSQADSSTTREYGGTGLGLSICKSLVEQMGGEIGVESRSGKGSTFWFELVLPLSRDNEAKVDEKVDLARQEIVICDNDHALDQYLLNQLTDWGAVCTHASSPEVLLTVLEQYLRVSRYPAKLIINGQWRSAVESLASEMDLSRCELIWIDHGGSSHQLKGKVIHCTGSLVKQLHLLDVLISHESENEDMSVSGESIPRADAQNRILLVEDNRINQNVALAQIQAIRPGA